MPKKKVLFLVEFDSFLKTILPVYDALQKEVDTDLILMQKIFKKSWITDDITTLLGNRPFTKKLSGFLSVKQIATYDVVVFASSSLRSFVPLHQKLSHYNTKTKCVTTYVGALLQNNPETFRNGVRRRAFGECICTPGEEASQRILATGLVDKQKTRVVATGIPRFDALHSLSETWKPLEERKLTLFLEQPTFPESPKERALLVDKLIAYAEAFPQKEVVIKPRFKALVGHAHRPKTLLPDILEKKTFPKNMRVSHDDIYTLFSDTCEALTISSTAGIEALLAGIPTYFITDFCGDNNRYGSHDFDSFENTCTLADLIEGKAPIYSAKQIHQVMKFDGNNTTDFTNEILALTKGEQ